jgi:hypothetical protein
MVPSLLHIVRYLIPNTTHIILSLILLTSRGSQAKNSIKLKIYPGPVQTEHVPRAEQNKKGSGPGTMYPTHQVQTKNVPRPGTNKKNKKT